MKKLYLAGLFLYSCNNIQSADMNVSHVDTVSENVLPLQKNDCSINNGRHSATVNYNNPKTGYSKTYTLDVEVDDCQVTTIYFDNGGYLDSTHMDAASIDGHGNAVVKDDKGRNFNVHLE